MAVSRRDGSTASRIVRVLRGGDQVDYGTIHLVLGGMLYNLAIALAELGR